MNARVAQLMAPGELHDPVDMHNFLEAVSNTIGPEWLAIQTAYRTGDILEFGQLLAEAAHRHALSDAQWRAEWKEAVCD